MRAYIQLRCHMHQTMGLCIHKWGYAEVKIHCLSREYIGMFISVLFFGLSFIVMSKTHAGGYTYVLKHIICSDVLKGMCA